MGSDEDKSDSFIENLLTLSEPLWLFDVLRNADGKIIASPITDARTGEYSALSYRIADRPLHSSKPVLDAMITSDNTIPECFLSLLPLLYGQQTQLLARLDLAGGDAEPYLIQPGMLNWIRNVFLFFTRKTVPPVSRAVCSMITAATPYFQVLLLPHHREMVIGLLTDREFEAADAVLNKVKTIRAQDVDGLAPFIQQAGQQASDAIWGTRAFYTANTPSGYVEPFCVGTVHPKTVCLYLAAPPKDWAELQRLQKFVFDSR